MHAVTGPLPRSRGHVITYEDVQAPCCVSEPLPGDPSARTRHASLGKVRAPACAPRRCSQRPGCGRSLGARPRGRRRGCPCTVDRPSAVREDATSPSVRSWTGLEGRHPGLSLTAEFPLLHKGVAASGRVTWQGLASRQTGNSQDEAAGYHGRREKPTGHGDADSLRGDGSGPRPCSAPVRLLGCPGLGAPTRRAGSPERAWPEGTGPCRQGEGGALPSLPPSSGAAFRFPHSSLPVGASARLSYKELFQNFSRSLSRTKLSFPRSESASGRRAQASETARVSEATPGAPRRGNTALSAVETSPAQPCRAGPAAAASSSGASVREAPQGHTLSSARAGYDLGTRNSETSNVGVFCRVTEQTTAKLKRGEAPRQGAGPGD